MNNDQKELFKDTLKKLTDVIDCIYEESGPDDTMYKWLEPIEDKFKYLAECIGIKID